MIRRLKWILIAAEAWGWRRKGRLGPCHAPCAGGEGVATQSAGLCRYLLYLPMVVKTP